MKSQKEKLPTTLTGISGEYFVAAELSRREFTAAVTLRNTRGVDILASHPRRKNPATIQVKTIQKGRSKWLLSSSDEEPKGNDHYYVFVALIGRDDPPEYYIVEGDKVSKQIASSHRKWLKGKRRDGGKHKNTKMREFHPDEKDLGQWDRILVD